MQLQHRRWLLVGAIVLAVAACGGDDVGVSVESDEGSVEVDAGGSVDVQSSEGSVSIDAGDQEVKVESDEGSVTISADEGIVIETDEGSVVLDLDADDGTVEIKSEEGDVSGVIGGSALPDGFPFPMPSEYEIGMAVADATGDGTTYAATLEVPIDDFDACAELYEEFLEDAGFDVDTERVTMTDAAVVVIDGYRSSDGIRATVTVNQGAMLPTSSDRATVTLAWEA